MVAQGRLEKALDIAFDLASTALSFLDIITDFAVLINFYQNGDMVYFGISLSFLVITQIAYAKLFTGQDIDISPFLINP